ncbi:MAG: hypothetical protein V3S29_03920, partial [bacterium]
DFPAALAASQEAIHASRDPLYLLVVHGAHCQNVVLNGRVDPDFEDIVNRARSLGIELLANWLGGSLGVGRIIEGRMGEGMKLIEESSRRSLDNGDHYTHMVLDWIKGRIYLSMATGERPPTAFLMKILAFVIRSLPFAARKAETLLEKSAGFFGEIEAHGTRAQVLLGLAKLHQARNRHEKARACLVEAEKLFEQVGAEMFLQRTRAELAALR